MSTTSECIKFLVRDAKRFNEYWNPTPYLDIKDPYKLSLIDENTFVCVNTYSGEVFEFKRKLDHPLCPRKIEFLSKVRFKNPKAPDVSEFRVDCKSWYAHDVLKEWGFDISNESSKIINENFYNTRVTNLDIEKHFHSTPEYNKKSNIIWLKGYKISKFMFVEGQAESIRKFCFTYDFKIHDYFKLNNKYYAMFEFSSIIPDDVLLKFKVENPELKFRDKKTYFPLPYSNFSVKDCELKEFEKSKLDEINTIETVNFKEENPSDKLYISKPVSGFISNVSKLSRKEILTLQDIAFYLAQSSSFRYRKLKYDSYFKLLIEIFGYARYQLENPRIQNSKIKLTASKRREYQVGYQFSRLWVERLKRFYNLKTNVHRDFNFLISIFFKLYKHSNGITYNSFLGSSRQFTGSLRYKVIHRIKNRLQCYIYKTCRQWRHNQRKFGAFLLEHFILLKLKFLFPGLENSPEYNLRL